ncbi:MAG: Fe-S-containing hydro-lyase [Deltaproteobacteria bacterium]|nr:Fe-S-containing hydro-lyase [Deltaproteobacteria bacterium]
MTPVTYYLTTPLTDADVAKLNIGDRVFLSGIIYTGRDAAHRRLVELLDRGEELPMDVAGQVIYYVGPSPASPGRVIGAAGPTTAYRMDAYAPRLLAKGLKAMVGKGRRADEVREAMVKHKAVYLTATGGAGALLSKCIKKVEIIAYEDLGPEAVRRMEVKDMPTTVVNDVHGRDLYAAGREIYEIKA